MKFCRDCRFLLIAHHMTGSYAHACTHRRSTSINKVTGVPSFLECFRMREPGGLCGVDADLFEPKIPRKKFLGLF